MTPHILNETLIKEIRDLLPPEIKVSAVLMQKLNIGKEAVYRRLQSEVPFTLAEAAIIAREMGISLDKLVGTTANGNAIFNFNITNYDNHFDTVYNIMDRLTVIFKDMVSTGETTFGFASNIIPQTFHSRYDLLVRFKIYRWIYQNGDGVRLLPFCESPLPDRITEKYRQYAKLTKDFSYSYYIFGPELTRALVQDIIYFRQLNLISAEEAQALRIEVHSLIDEIEMLSNTDYYENGNKVDIYISNTDKDASYAIFESQNASIGLLRLFSLNTISSTDQNVTGRLREWLTSLKKFTTLITRSGEMQRIAFFNHQRDLADSI